MSCDDVPFHPPSLELLDIPGGPYLSWYWTGDTSMVRGFSIYDGNIVLDTGTVADYAPRQPGAAVRFPERAVRILSTA